MAEPFTECASRFPDRNIVQGVSALSSMINRHFVPNNGMSRGMWFAKITSIVKNLLAYAVLF